MAGTLGAGMTGVLEEYPLDFSRPELRAIRDVLARVFYQPRELEDLVLATGLNPARNASGASFPVPPRRSPASGTTTGQWYAPPWHHPAIAPY